MSDVLDLVGPKGYIHNWIYVGTPGGRVKNPESTKGRHEAYRRGLALSPASPGAPPGYPVTDAKHWDKAFRAVGRAGSPQRRAQLRKLLIRTAPQFGRTGRIKGSWLDKRTAHAHGNDGTGALTLSRRMPITNAGDIIVSRAPDGSAVIRHRMGGATIGTIRRGDDGLYHPQIDGGQPGQGKVHQRAALLDLLTGWQSGAVTPERRPMPLQQPPVQTPVMDQLGIQNVRVLATPAVSASDGPRMTTRGAGSAAEHTGLSRKGVTIYRKLRGKGHPAARALQFARRAQSFGGSRK